MGCTKNQLEALPQVLAAWLLGISPRTLRDKVECPRNPNGSYSARAIVEWVRSGAESDPDAALLAGSDSPNLERLRAAKADREEIALAKDRNEVISVAQLHAALTHLAAILRRCGDKLGLRHGVEAQQLMNDAIDEFQRWIETGLPKVESIGATMPEAEQP
jgi:phage terminase Nu1 subunit (DNA packaging protein)